MKSLLIMIMAAISFSALNAFAEKEKAIDADCYYLGGTHLTNDAVSTGSAASYDKKFETDKGIIKLDPKTVTKYAFGKLDYTEWTGKRTINLGAGYSLNLHLKYQEQVAAGDFLVDAPTLQASAIYFYKDKAISSGFTSTNIPETTDKKQFLNAHMTLDNLPLRVYLKATDRPEADLRELMRDPVERKKIFDQFGDGKGVMLLANVHCEVPYSKPKAKSTKKK